MLNLTINIHTSKHSCLFLLPPPFYGFSSEGLNMDALLRYNFSQTFTWRICPAHNHRVLTTEQLSLGHQGSRWHRVILVAADEGVERAFYPSALIIPLSGRAKPANCLNKMSAFLASKLVLLVTLYTLLLFLLLLLLFTIHLCFSKNHSLVFNNCRKRTFILKVIDIPCHTLLFQWKPFTINTILFSALNCATVFITCWHRRAISLQEILSVSSWHVNGCMLVAVRTLGQEFNYSQIKDTRQQGDECMINKKCAFLY